MIKILDVCHHYGLRPVLGHIDLDIPEGKLVAIMGPIGAKGSVNCIVICCWALVDMILKKCQYY